MTLEQKYIRNYIRIKELKKQIPKTNKYLEKSTLIKCNYETEITALRNEFDETDRKLMNLRIDERSINNQFDLAKQQKPIDITDFDISIKAVSESIGVLTKKHSEKECDRLS